MTAVKGNKAIVEALMANETSCIFGICGTSVAGFLSALSTEDRIRYIICRHERGAGSMADGYARASGRVGVCQMHSGAGTLNGVLSIVDAYRDSSPVVLLAGQVARKYIGREIFGEAKQVEILKTYTKAQLRIEQVETIPSVICDAFQIARTGRPGPVLLEIPEDIYLLEGIISPLPKIEQKMGSLPFEIIHDAVDRLIKSENPLILAGGGIIWSDATVELKKLAEMLQIPVATTQNGRGAFPENHPLALGVIGWYGGNEVADFALESADLILGIGCSFSSLTTYLFTSPIKGDIIHVNIDPSVIGQNIPSNYNIAGDAKAVLIEMLQVLKTNPPKSALSPWLDKLNRRKAKFLRSLKSGTTADSTPIQPQRLVSEIHENIPKDAIIVTGAGLHHLFVVNYTQIITPRTFLSATNLGSMGFAFPAAIGAKAAKPSRDVVCLIGDGDFLMSVPDLATAVEYNFNVIAVIMNNSGYYAPKTLQKMTFGTEFGSDYSNPNFEKLAQSFGAEGWTIERPTEIVDVLKQALGCGKPAIIDAKIDPSTVPPVNFKASFRLRGENH